MPICWHLWLENAYQIFSCMNQCIVFICDPFETIHCKNPSRLLQNYNLTNSVDTGQKVTSVSMMAGHNGSKQRWITVPCNHFWSDRRYFDNRYLSVNNRFASKLLQTSAIQKSFFIDWIVRHSVFSKHLSLGKMFYSFGYLIYCKR